MLSLFVMLKYSWMEFLENKMELFFFLSLIEVTEVVVHSIEDDVWKAKDEGTDALNDRFGS